MLKFAVFLLLQIRLQASVVQIMFIKWVSYCPVYWQMNVQIFFSHKYIFLNRKWCNICGLCHKICSLWVVMQIFDTSSCIQSAGRRKIAGKIDFIINFNGFIVVYFFTLQVLLQLSLSLSEAFVQFVHQEAESAANMMHEPRKNKICMK